MEKGRNKKNTSHGFTLIELLVVISIISLLSSIILSATASARKQARDSKRIQDINTLLAAMETYRTDKGFLPPNEHDDTADQPQAIFSRYDFSNQGSFIPALVSGTYIDRPAKDPLGYSYIYVDNQFYTPLDHTDNIAGYCLKQRPNSSGLIMFYLENQAAANGAFQQCNGVPAYFCVCME